VKKWGSDAVLDYRKEDILNSGKRYDVVLDLSGKLPYQCGKKDHEARFSVRKQHTRAPGNCGFVCAQPLFEERNTKSCC
jgi:hypothetical protein